MFVRVAFNYFQDCPSDAQAYAQGIVANSLQSKTPSRMNGKSTMGVGERSFSERSTKALNSLPETETFKITWHFQDQLKQFA